MEKKNNTYPKQYIKEVRLRDGTTLRLRPILPADSEQASELNNRVSKRSLYKRFMGHVIISDALVKRFTDIDYSKEIAIVAEFEKDIIAIARIASDGLSSGEFGILIADKWQGRGLGSLLTDYMISIAKDMGLKSISALFFSDHSAMIAMLKHRGFILKKEDYTTIRAELYL